MQELKKVLQYKYLFYGMFFLIILISYFRVNFKNNSFYGGDEHIFKLTVNDIKHKLNNDIVTFSGNEKLISYIKDFSFDVGDIVLIKGNLIKTNNNTIPNLFNYSKYLQSRGINWKLEINGINLVSKNSNIFYKIKKLIISNIEKIPHNEYIYAFLLGDTSYINNNIKEKYQTLGISYVLALGSFQIMMIVKVLDKIKMRDKRKLILTIIVISLYILFTNRVIGVLRSGLCYLIKRILKYNKIKYKNYNIILLVGIILLIINPYYIINIGFLYSFSISLAISLLSDKITGNYFEKLFKVSIIAFIVSLPITIYSNYEINFLAIIFSFIMIPLFHYYLFPLSILVFFFPFFSYFFNISISFIERIINVLSNIDIFIYIFRKPSMFVIIIYYIIITLFFYNKKYLYLLCLIILVHININKVFKEDLISFLDVNQGDSIVLKRNNSLYLIDTGGNNYEHSSKIIKYIKSLGISKIDKLLLTHGDYDHMGEAINLVNNFKVEKVIFNCGPYNDLEKELIKVLDKKKIKYYSCIKEVNIDKNKLYFLQTKEYDNENDNSNVIYTELNGYKFMFMGDAGVEKEKDILEKYTLSNIDVLKVGHHGSKTSSSKEFINDINPKYSIISVGKNNRYGHPNKEVLENLKDSKIYRTDQDGSILFKIKSNKLKIETCSP